ncbi:hypothetical protein [Aestuariivivens sediminicola]|uniref:hypothetical protein n=1 Tax=Aestuariivivens sediminicola TaxID=2913560 RepID=UPI001F565AE7|nr:hypothetical protein [Aestuariivivens sediminicola]
MATYRAHEFIFTLEHQPKIPMRIRWKFHAYVFLCFCAGNAENMPMFSVFHKHVS